MARRGQTQQAVLPPISGWRGGSRQPAGRMAPDELGPGADSRRSSRPKNAGTNPMTQTDLIDRYLNAVKLWLPRKQQKDILAELAEDLHSQIEDRESALGRPLEEAELVDLLKRRGAPTRVASGYIPEHRLINPAMLPIYRLVLKIVLLWVLAPIFALVFIGPLFDSQSPGKVLAAFFATAFQSLFFVIGIV